MIDRYPTAWWMKGRQILLVACVALVIPGCGGAPTGNTDPVGNPPDNGTTPDVGGTDNTGGGDTGGNVLLNESLGSEGTLSGKVVDTQTTRESSADQSAAQVAPPTLDTTTARVHFKDLIGNDLLDPNGDPIPSVPVESDGSFEAAGLPVGVDLTLCVDMDADGACDLESCVNIPGTVGSQAGDLKDVRADPLTTVVLAKLRRLMQQRELDPRDLPISPVALVTRIVEAYTHLFEEAGIDEDITLADLEGMSKEELASLFELAVPTLAQTGMKIAEGNMDLASAVNVNDVAKAAAEVFLRAGFPIADAPDGPDFSHLADLDGVVWMSMDEFLAKMQPQGEFEDSPPMDEPFREGDPNDPFLGPAEAGTAPAHENVVVYYSDIDEPDRNRGVGEDGDGDMGPRGPILNDHVLAAMARLHIEHKQITLGTLHQMLVSLEDGLGLRLTYFVFDPNFHGPPLNIFQTADGRGKAINVEDMRRRVFEGGFGDLDEDDFRLREAAFRQLLVDLLGDTVAPEFDRMLGAVARDRFAGAEDMAQRIRNARAHLPFSRSGPSAFYVVADGDSFAPDAVVSAVTVDAVVHGDDTPPTVTYNAEGNGIYYLGFTEGTDREGKVELIVRETGRGVHGPRGPVRLSIYNENIFQPINGAPFADFVSNSGSFYPGVNISVVRDEFMFDQVEPDFSGSVDAGLTTAEADGAGERHGPNQQLFVLATEPGGEPVRVNYDRATGAAIVSDGGRYLLMFQMDTADTGMFGLFNEATGRPATVEDPSSFFDAPPERPEGFEDFFNIVDDFDDVLHLGDDPNFGDFDGLDDLIDLLPDDPFDPTAPTDGTEDANDQSTSDTNAPTDGTEDAGDQSTSDTDPDIAPAEDPGFVEPTFIMVSAGDVIGLNVVRELFTQVYGVEVPNVRYDPDGDPYYDDINENDVQDPDEPTAPWRPTLFNLNDWRSTDIRLYYRRAIDNGVVLMEEVDFEADTPRLRDGTVLVRRHYKARMNAFRFGRPNAAMNLLTAFLPPEFFDGTHGLNRDTPVDIFTAIAIINLIMDQVFNVDADVDIDGLGPLPRQRMLMDAHMFTVPVGDPFVLLLNGFRTRSIDRPER